MKKRYLGLGLLLSALTVCTMFVAAANLIEDPGVPTQMVGGPPDEEGMSESMESDYLASVAEITPDEAKNIALNAVDTGVVGALSDLEIENEEGIAVYAVEFSKNGFETETKIDAVSGKIVKIEDVSTEEDVEDAGSEVEDKDSDYDVDGVDHQFEGEEEHED